MNLGLLSASIDVGNNRLQRAVAQALGKTVASGNTAASDEVARQLRDQQVTINQPQLENQIASMGAQVGRLLRQVQYVQNQSSTGSSSVTTGQIQALQQANQKLRAQLTNFQTDGATPQQTKIITDLQKELADKNAELQQLESTHQATIRQLQLDLSQAQSDLRNAKSEGADKLAEAQDAHRQHNLNVNIRSALALQQKIEELDQAQSKLDDAMKKVENLENKLKECEREMTNSDTDEFFEAEVGHQGEAQSGGQEASGQAKTAIEKENELIVEVANETKAKWRDGKTPVDHKISAWYLRRNPGIVLQDTYDVFHVGWRGSPKGWDDLSRYEYKERPEVTEKRKKAAAAQAAAEEQARLAAAAQAAQVEEQERLAREQREQQQREQVTGATPGQPPARGPGEPPYTEPGFGSTGEFELAEENEEFGQAEEKEEFGQAEEKEESDDSGAANEDYPPLSDALMQTVESSRKYMNHLLIGATSAKEKKDISPSRSQLTKTYGQFLRNGDVSNSVTADATNWSDQIKKPSYVKLITESVFNSNMGQSKNGILYAITKDGENVKIRMTNGEQDATNDVANICHRVFDLVLSDGKRMTQGNVFTMMCLVIHNIGLKDDSNVVIVSPNQTLIGNPEASYEPSPFSSMFMWM